MYTSFCINISYHFIILQLCITLNNIVHVIQYIQGLPELLEWSKVCQNMSVKYEDETIGQRCMATLQRLIHTTQEELICRAQALWSKVIDLMEKDLEHYITSFTRCHSTKISVSTTCISLASLATRCHSTKISLKIAYLYRRPLSIHE